MTNSVSSNRPEKYNIAAFFSGVGGIELGFEQTNEFRVVYANEFDKYARQTYQLNHPDTYLDGRDIHDVQPEDIPAERVDVIMGGFPCLIPKTSMIKDRISLDLDLELLNLGLKN